MATDFEEPTGSSTVEPPSNANSSNSARLADEIQVPTASNELLSTSNIGAPIRSYRRDISSESSLSSIEERYNYGDREHTKRSKKEINPSFKDISRKLTKTYDQSHMRQRRAISSSPSSGEDRNRRATGRDFVNRRSDISPPIPYFRDQSRERSRMRRIKESTESPSRTSRERSRTSNDLSGMRPRRRPQTPPTPKKSKEKIPYFRDAVREKDRLRRKYKSPSPIVKSNRHRSSRSRTLRRHRSRSRSCSRSRSKSRHRKSGSDHYRRKRESWPQAPQIITIPVPVPDYSFSFPPYHPQHGWPHLPIRPPRYPYFPHHLQRSSRQAPFNATSPAALPPYAPFPPMSPMRFMPPYGIPQNSHML